MKKSVIVLWHIAYWFMYSLIVLLVWAGGQDHNNPPHYDGVVMLKVSFRIVFFSLYSLLATWPGIIGFYLFYFILFDKFLTKKKILKLVLTALVIIVLTPLLLEGIVLITNPNFNGELIGPAIAMSVITCVHGILGLVLKGFITWYQEIKVKVALTKKNYETEIALIKAQINPHFLFNTINNIDILIQKDPVKASEYLNKLSDIMRFMLYETKTDRISLTKELSYIEKYVELQKIRTTNSNYVKYDVIGEAANILIEPMLFIPFIENAFKHSENKKLKDAIKINFTIEKDKIKFECENVYPNEMNLKPEYGGLGNDLIQRRLELLYPNKHTFEIINKNGIYKVHLLISLKNEN